MDILKNIAARSKVFKITLGILITLFIGYLDYVTGVEFNFSIFYLIPITLVAWTSGLQAGIFISIFASLVQLLANLEGVSFYSHPGYLYWTIILKSGFFLIVVYLLYKRKLYEGLLLQKSQELARSNSALEQYAYAASHDLKEPLRSISGYLYLLDKKYKGKLDAEAEKFIAHASNSAVRMQTLITDLLEYSNVGAVTKNIEATDSSWALRMAIENLEAVINETGAKLEYKALPTVKASHAGLVHIFQNLIGNAVKFRGKEAPVIAVAAVQEGNAWRFSVRDNGMGIEPRYFDKIFEVFERLHTRDEYPGSGIGLALCSRIVESWGGKIWVESEPDKGSTFYFTVLK